METNCQFWSKTVCFGSNEANQTRQYADDIKDYKHTQLLFRIDSWKPLLGRPRNKAILWTKDPSGGRLSAIRKFLDDGYTRPPYFIEFCEEDDHTLLFCWTLIGVHDVQVHWVWFNEGNVQPRIFCLIKLCCDWAYVY